MPVVLVGFSGSGKSSVARHLKNRPGLVVVDTDELVEQLAGVSPDKLIRVDGEARFREFEERAVQQALESDAHVICTGGGTLTREVNEKRLTEAGLVVYLDTSVSTLIGRLTADPGQRPLVAGDDAARRIAQLFESRRALYERAAAVTIVTDWSTVEEVAEHVAELVAAGENDNPMQFRIPLQATKLGGGVEVGTGSVHRLAQWLASRSSKATKVMICSDQTVSDLYLADFERELSHLGCEVFTHILTPGEQSKSLSDLQQVLESLSKAGLSRKDVFIALGGGMVGDLGGLAASLYLRGVRLVQVPTSLVAQADAAIGGKTAINFEVDGTGGKNQVGTFYPAELVLSDSRFLTSLSERSYWEGFGEIIKYGLIYSSTFLEWLEANVDSVASRDIATLQSIVEFSSKAKLHFVVGDLEDTGGERAKLNFGHTMGHVLEKLSGYEDLLHGEAVALGMVFALRFGESRGIGDATLAGRVSSLLGKYQLPTQLTDKFFERNPSLRDRNSFESVVRTVLYADKKRHTDQLDFVFVTTAGEATVVPVAVEDVVAFASEVLLPSGLS